MSNKNIEIYPLLYAGPISYYAYFISNPGTFDLHEHLGKQSFRNRARIYGANGVITLSIPIHGHSQKQAVKDVEISNVESWQRNHWKTLVSAYQSSPFFEYYTHLFEPLFVENYTHLFEFNLAIHKVVLHCLQLDIHPKFTGIYEPMSEVDFRIIYSSKKPHRSAEKFEKYQQVFSYHQTFEKDLSILDALFNLGPETENYLRRISSIL